MKKLAQVALVGRRNVGKSSLFNRLAEQRKSLVYDLEGVTRDTLQDTVTWNNTTFELVDTGGLLPKDRDVDILQKQVNEKVFQVVRQATVVVFVCDGRVGPVQDDMILARMLHQQGCPVVLVINKLDNPQAVQDAAYEFLQLGFEKQYAISALHGTGVADMLDEVVQCITQEQSNKPVKYKPEPKFKTVLVGKPNVGKSSLLNQLAQQEVSIVSDIEGTTREPLFQNIAFNKEHLAFVDTAGVRRKKSVQEPLETLMVKSTLDAIRKANIVVLVLSADEPFLSSQVLKLATYTFKEGAALVVALNKTDLFTDATFESWKDSMYEYNFLMKKFEVLNISCKTAKNVGRLFPLLNTVWDRYNMRIPEHELHELLMTAVLKRPLYKNEIRLQLYTVKQVGYAPMRIELTVQYEQLWEEHHLGYLENVLRSTYNLKSCPIFFYVKQKK